MRRIQFDAFEVDLDLFTIRRNGERLPVGQRTLDLLICLIENSNRVVDHEFLRREVWDSATLSPAAIPTCALELRRALNDDPSHPKFIESIRGRGEFGDLGYVENVSSQLPEAGDVSPGLNIAQ